MMNDRAKMVIFNRASLMKLKAELLKKQEEVLEKKCLPQHKLENFNPPTSKPTENDEKSLESPKKSLKDTLKAIDLEELEACKKSKAALEKKAALYEHLSDPVGESQLAGQFLVDFSAKKQQDSAITTTATEEQLNEDDDSEWIEFTDCLGRTRKCHKTELDSFKEHDQQLKRSIKLHLEVAGKSDGDMMPPPPISEKPFLVQKTNDYLNSLRDKWEIKEKELLAKDKDIHYQDLLYDEARMHGVSYYSFSTDENERKKQMEELVKVREETLRAQKVAEEKRKKQDDVMATRLKASKALQRVRQGLPPEDPEDAEKDFNTSLMEFLNKQKQEADAKANEEEKNIKEELEKERQKLREAYIREWDQGKEGVKDGVKKFKELTQEEYVDQQRAKRLDEFAPLPSTSMNKSDSFYDDKGRKVQEELPSTSKTWSDVRPRMTTPPPPFIGDWEENKGLYFSTSKKTAPTLKYKNYVKTQEDILVVNEFDDIGCCSPEEDKRHSSHAEIPPPPTYDYYGPASKHPKFDRPFDSDVEEAYDQGAESLKPKKSNRELHPQYDFSFE